jgi:hypothetical protein
MQRAAAGSREVTRFIEGRPTSCWSKARGGQARGFESDSRLDHASPRLLNAYVADLENVVDLEAVHGSGSSSASIRWAAPACTTGQRSPSATD